MATSINTRGRKKKNSKRQKLKSKGQLIVKGKWKSVNVDSVDIPLFDDTGGLTLFEELDDYDLVIEKSGGKKNDVEDEEITDSQIEQFKGKSEKKVKKRKKQGDKIESEPPKKKKKKKPIQKETKSEKIVELESPMDEETSKDVEEDSCQGDEEDALVEEEDEEWKNVEMSDWLNLFVPEPVLHGLADQQFTKPTPIQMKCLPSAIRDYQDIVGAAETGSGKTLAFGIPILHHILKIQEKGERQRDGLLGLILTPTRELAIQVKNHLVAVSKYTDIKIAVVVGGMSAQKQERILKKKPQIVIATPGRLWELIQQGEPHLNTVIGVKYLVLDEADRMVEKGHYAELTSLLDLINGSETPQKRQTFVFSATLTMIHLGPDRKLMKTKYNISKEQKLDSLIAKIGIREDQMKVVDLTKKEMIVETLTEAKINCSLEEKDFYLFYFLLQYPGRTLVFTNSIDCIRRLISVFTLLVRKPLPLHANMHQKQRLKNLERFSSDPNGLLLATDVAARGLDIPNVQHVVHYQVPRTAEIYVHRSGRTARATKEGLSLMLIGADDVAHYKRLCKTLNRDEEIPVFPVEMKYLTAVKERVNTARRLDKMEHQFMKKKHHNDWFTKAAKELDIDLDEDLCLHDMGDNYEQKQHERKVKNLKMDLKSLLQKPIFPKGYSTLYPTVAGRLSVPMMHSNASQHSMSAITAVKRDRKETGGFTQTIKLPRKQKSKKHRRKRKK